VLFHAGPNKSSRPKVKYRLAGKLSPIPVSIASASAFGPKRLPKRVIWTTLVFHQLFRSPETAFYFAVIQ
jgi:hypothetical protein